MQRTSYFTRIICLSLMVMGFPVWAADFSDPDWPCLQRKVIGMSQGLMWSHPIRDKSYDAKTVQRVKALTDRLALRRTQLDEAEQQIEQFVQETARRDRSVLLGQVFARVFARLDADRTRIINGIVRYAREQVGLSEKIETARQEMLSLERAKTPNFDRMDALEAQLDWDERIFRDRTQALNYVCETPVIIEKRAYALAKLLEAHLP